MECQLNPNEEKEYQYKIQANVGGHFRTRAMCEIENKFSLDDIPSDTMEIYVSPLGIRIAEVEVRQDQWKEIGFIFENLSDEVMTNLSVSLKKGSKFDMDNIPTHDGTLAPDQCVTIPMVMKTKEIGSVSLDLVVACTDENGEKYTTEKNFLVQVAESDKTVTKVDIGEIGKVVSSGATNIEGDVSATRSVVGGAAINEGWGDDMLYDGGKSAEAEVNGSIARRSARGSETCATESKTEPKPEPEKTCPKCGDAVQIGWKMCPFCGTQLELKCPNCDHDVEEGWKMCPFCGEQLG